MKFFPGLVGWLSWQHFRFPPAPTFQQEEEEASGPGVMEAVQAQVGLILRASYPLGKGSGGEQAIEGPDNG